jgi:hypothetical protein
MHPLLLFVAAITVHTDFDGGSTGRVETVSPTHLRVAVKGESDQNKRNRQGSWYYFRVDGAGRKPLVIDMVDLAGEYNFRKNLGAITGDTPPLISYDRKTWTHLTKDEVEYDKAEPRLRLKITPKQARFWIAHTPPYTNDNLALLRKAVGSKREEVIGKSAGGRDLLLWTIGSGPKTAWLMFRQHSWESGTSWVGEGAVRALLQNDRGITWKIFPMCDPDGVARGGVRFNVNGYDLNRNWDTIDPKLMPEIVAQHAAVGKWINSGRTIELYFTQHNTETAEYLQGPPGPVLPVGQKLFDILVRDTTFHPSRPLFSGETTTTEGMKGRMTVVQGLWHDFKIPAFLMEQRIAYNEKLKRLPTVEDRLKFGPQLVDAIAAALR